MAKAGANPTAPPGRRKFKSVDELDITNEERDAITTILAALERGEVVHATDENEIPHGINMGDTDRDLAHWIRSRCHEKKRSSSLGPLIHPPAELILGSLTAEEIIAAMKSFLSDGVVRWRDKVIEPSAPPPSAVAASSPRAKRAGNQHNRLVGLMRDLGLRSGMSPREVRSAVEKEYKTKYRGLDQPSASTITRAYQAYTPTS